MFIGIGTQFLRGDGATPTEAFTAIASILDMGEIPTQRESIEVTAMDSTGGYREAIPGLKDNGEMTLTLAWTPADTGHIALRSDFNSDTVRNYRIVWSDTGSTQADFAGFVMSTGVTTPIGDKVTMKVTIKISGPITFA